MILLPFVAALTCYQRAMCSCELLRPAEAVARAAAILEAVPVAVRDTSFAVHGQREKARQRIYTLATSRRWKGEHRDTLEIWTGRGGGDCGFPFDVGSPYLVLTEEFEGHSRVSICSGTKRLEEAAAELGLLGEPH
jgi:hypothetical protein